MVSVAADLDRIDSDFAGCVARKFHGRALSRQPRISLTCATICAAVRPSPAGVWRHRAADRDLWRGGIAGYSACRRSIAAWSAGRIGRDGTALCSVRGLSAAADLSDGRIASGSCCLGGRKSARRALFAVASTSATKGRQHHHGLLRELVSLRATSQLSLGVAFRESADGYAQLLGPEWGLDDTTIAGFEQRRRTFAPGAGPQRFARARRSSPSHPSAGAWLEWRAAQRARFYHRVYEEIAAIRPGARLYWPGPE